MNLLRHNCSLQENLKHPPDHAITICRAGGRAGVQDVVPYYDWNSKTKFRRNIPSNATNTEGIHLMIKQKPT